MGGRRPGPLCGTASEPIDRGTNCRSRSDAPGTLGPPALSGPRHKPVGFKELWEGYPSEMPYVDPRTGNAPKGYENQCAIRVSIALHAAKVSLLNFRGAHVMVDNVRAAIRAQELAAWLKAQRIDGLPAVPETVTGSDWQHKISGRTGIAYFADYWLRTGEKNPSGDHIDLWNGARLTASGIHGAIVTIARFGLGIDEGPGFSDLGKSRTILFWEVR